MAKKDELLERGKQLKDGSAKKLPKAPTGDAIQKAPAHEVTPKARYIYNDWVMGQPLEQVTKLNKICGGKRRPSDCMKLYAPTKSKSMF